MIGKGKVDLKINNKYVSNVLFIEWIQQNIPSVGQIVYKGHEVIFISRWWNIIEKYTKKLIAKVTETLEKVYVLKKSKVRNKRLKEISSSDSD